MCPKKIEINDQNGRGKDAEKRPVQPLPLSHEKNDGKHQKHEGASFYSDVHSPVERRHVRMPHRGLGEGLEEKQVKKIKLRLPKGYVTFKDSNPIYPPHREALNYLKSRGITDDIIEKYRIGYTMKGDYSGRIIVPSYTKEGELNYFVGRAWGGNPKFKYKNSIAEKDKIIFNEHLIDWEKDIYIVEGVFDGFFLENSIPMLGKHLSSVLFESIYFKSKGTQYY